MTGRSERGRLRIIAPDVAHPGNPYYPRIYHSLRRCNPEAEATVFTVRRLLLGRYDVWHLHDPDRQMDRSHPLLRFAAFVALGMVARLIATKMVWTIFQVASPEVKHPAIERAFMGWLARRVDAYIAISPGAREYAVRRYPALARKPFAIAPMGHYIGAYPNSIKPRDARARLGIPLDAPVVGHVGRIAPYKNIERLVKAFQEIDLGAATLASPTPTGDDSFLSAKPGPIRGSASICGPSRLASFNFS